MFSKIINFIKYHNAFSVGLMIVFVGFNVSLAASEDLRGNFISSQNSVRSVDNSYVLAVDLDNLNFDLQIKEITEDAGKYYIVYNYKTVAIADYVWQDVSTEKTLTVSRAALDGRDLGLYVAEELGENIDNELSYLKEAQVLEKKKGLTQKIATTEYAGLVGRFLSSEEKVFPGYEPVVKTPEPEVVIAQTEPPAVVEETSPPAPTPVEQPVQAPVDRELIRQIVQEVLDQAALDDAQTNEPQIIPPADDPVLVCTPVWGCDEWQQPTDSVSCDEAFTQTRICTDNNNCGTDENKPVEIQTAIGVDCSSDNPVNSPADVDPVCGTENLDLCDENNCGTGASGYWYNDVCNLEEKPEEPVETATNTPPVITLTQAFITLTVGDAFDPADYAATIDPDGDTVTQHADSSVDTTVIGTYSVEYTAEDEHGMWAEPQTLSVIVEALAEPVCGAENLDLCDESNCGTDAGGYYYNSECHNICQEFTFYLDGDGDTFGDINNSISACEVPDNHVSNSDDCDDNDASINPNVAEICGNDIDENCDGVEE